MAAQGRLRVSAEEIEALQAQHVVFEVCTACAIVLQSLLILCLWHPPFYSVALHFITFDGVVCVRVFVPIRR